MGVGSTRPSNSLVPCELNMVFAEESSYTNGLQPLAKYSDDSEQLVSQNLRIWCHEVTVSWVFYHGKASTRASEQKWYRD